MNFESHIINSEFDPANHISGLIQAFDQGKTPGKGVDQAGILRRELAKKTAPKPKPAPAPKKAGT